MSIYISNSKTIYTDETFPDLLDNYKIWQNRDLKKITVKPLSELANLLDIGFITEIKPFIYVFDDEIVDLSQYRSGLITENRLVKYFTDKINKKVSFPPYIKGLMKIKYLRQL